MKKLVSFALALTSLALVPTSAMAIQTNLGYDISIAIRDRGQHVGQLVFRAAEVSEDGADLSGDLGFDEDVDLDACTYQVKWTNDAELPSRTSLQMLELSTVGY